MERVAGENKEKVERERVFWEGWGDRGRMERKRVCVFWGIPLSVTEMTHGNTQGTTWCQEFESGWVGCKTNILTPVLSL